MAIAFIRRSRLSYRCSEGNHEWVSGGTEELHAYCKQCNTPSEAPHSYSSSYQWADDCSECTVTYGCNCGYVKGSETSSNLIENNRRPATCTEPEKRDYVAVFTNYDNSGACNGWHDFPGADPATGHSLGNWQYVDSISHIAYCTNTDSYLNQACTYSEEEGHVETKPPTCSHGSYCQKCNNYFGDVRPENHEWDTTKWVDIEDQTYHAVVCRECNAVEPTWRSNHIYGDWVTNEDYHWKECVGSSISGVANGLDNAGCGKRTSEGAHTASEYTKCYEVNSCSVCGIELEGYGEHELSNTADYNDTYHWFECIYNYKHSDNPYSTDREKHAFEDTPENTRCTDVLNCTTSGCGYTIAGTKHSWNTTWSSNELNHWHACSNNSDHKKDGASHTYKNASNYYCYQNVPCEVCGRESTTKGTSHQAWEDTYKNDENYHWIECTRCYEKKPNSYGAHSSDDGTVADCLTKVKCSTCKYEMEDYGPHNWGPWQIYTAEQHIRYCITASANGKTHQEAAEHSMTIPVAYIPPTCTSEGSTAGTKCSECGQTKGVTSIDKIPHKFGSWEYKDANEHYRLCTYLCNTEETEDHEASEEWEQDASQHYKYCIGCGCELDRDDHNPSELWSSNNERHWHACKQCEFKMDSATHSGGTATCISQAKCSVCKQLYGDMGNHDWSTTLGFNNTHHWTVCTRDTNHTKDKSSHSPKYGEVLWDIQALGSCAAHYRMECRTSGCAYKSDIHYPTVTTSTLTAATCTADGKARCTTTIDGQVYTCSTDHVIPATGHSWDASSASKTNYQNAYVNNPVKCDNCSEVCYHTHENGSSAFKSDGYMSYIDENVHDEHGSCEICGFTTTTGYWSLGDTSNYRNIYKHTYKYKSINAEKCQQECIGCGHTKNPIKHTASASAPNQCYYCGYPRPAGANWESIMD